MNKLKQASERNKSQLSMEILTRLKAHELVFGKPDKWKWEFEREYIKAIPIYLSEKDEK